MNAETKMARPPKGAATTEHRGGKNPRAKTGAFVALLLLGLLAGGAWADAQAPESGTAAEETYRTGQQAGGNIPPAQSGDIPVRLHPRGLPQRTARQRARQEVGSGSEPVTRAYQKGERT